MPIAPWLSPPNFLGAMEAGTQAGLALRRQGDEEAQFSQRASQQNQDEQARQAEAAARLKLSYDSLQQQHDLSQQEIVARQKQAMAADALRQHAQDSLTEWRQQQAQNQQERLKIAAQNALKTATTTEPLMKTFDDGTSVIYNPKAGGFHVVTPSGQAKPMTAAEELKLAGMTDDADFKKLLLGDLQNKSGVGTNNAPVLTAAPDAAASLFQPQGQPEPLTLDVTPQAPQAVGGYKIGSSYKGLTYLGGDPNDETSWQKKTDNAQ